MDEFKSHTPGLFDCGFPSQSSVPGRKIMEQNVTDRHTGTRSETKRDPQSKE